jgi:hypothetical protein
MASKLSRVKKETREFEIPLNSEGDEDSVWEVTLAQPEGQDMGSVMEKAQSDPVGSMVDMIFGSLKKHQPEVERSEVEELPFGILLDLNNEIEEMLGIEDAMEGKGNPNYGNNMQMQSNPQNMDQQSLQDLRKDLANQK